MIEGNVQFGREAVVALQISGTGGASHEIEAVVDTGFTGSLTLPPDLITQLGLVWRTRGKALLANGAEDEFDIYVAEISWDGQMRKVLVESADTEPLLGMRLLSGYSLYIEAIDGGKVEIQQLP